MRKVSEVGRLVTDPRLHQDEQMEHAMTDIPQHIESTVEVAAGVLVVRDWGPRDAHPVVFHHGTPSTSMSLPGGWAHIHSTGARIITFDRPGYGGSTNRPGRKVGDAGDWTAAIADALGLDRISVMGTSGGGPHAAAAAARLGDRVTRVCVSVGLGPVGLEGFDHLAGMLPESTDEFERAARSEPELRGFIEAHMAEEEPLAVWNEQIPPSDQEVMARPDVQREEQEEDAALGVGGNEGWLEDDLAFFGRPWDCDLSRITAEVLLVFGGADVFVPHAHGDAYLRAIGHGQLVKLPTAGHYMRDAEPGILTWLSSTEPGPARLT